MLWGLSPVRIKFEFCTDRGQTPCKTIAQQEVYILLLTFKKGLRDGIPICLGYISVSFTFGMMAANGGLPVWLSIFISVTNVTSAGQFAGLTIILAAGSLIELAITTVIINLRYMLMSFSLSQKVDPNMSLGTRLAISFGITDEIFAVSMQQKGRITGKYFAGLFLLPYLGWALGTFLGAGAAGLLPESVRGALGIAIYGMFLAIIIPPARKSKAVLFTIALASALSCVFRYVPLINQLSAGWVIIICAVVSSMLSAVIFPVEPEEEAGQ